MVQAVRDKVGGKDAVAAVSDALRVLRIEGDALHERAVGYVLEGESPELVLELRGRDTTDLDAALSRPGFLTWTWTTDEIEKRVKKVTHGQRVEKAARTRGVAYTHVEVTPEQLSRMGRLLAAIAPDTEVAADVPDWFGVLVQDALLTRVGGHERNRPTWSPERMEAVARAGGLDAADAPAAVVWVLLARPGRPITRAASTWYVFFRHPRRPGISPVMRTSWTPRSSVSRPRGRRRSAASWALSRPRRRCAARSRRCAPTPPRACAGPPTTSSRRCPTTSSCGSSRPCWRPRPRVRWRTS
jgi:hypothetical protein